jgi:hypothetical protein
MKNTNKFLAAVLLAAAFCLAGAAFAALPKNHAEFLKDEEYQHNFDRFSATMDEAKERLTPDEYKALERENDEAIAESVREDMASGSSEAEAWAGAYLYRAEHIGNVLTWDWLKKNAKGVVGFYKLKSGAFDGYMTVQDSDEKDAYAIYIYAIQKAGGADNNGELEGLGRLEGTKMRVDYGNDDQSATVDIAFNGETANVTTSGVFKESGWFGANVIIDGEYLREKK